MSAADYFRYTPVGHLIRAASRGSVLAHAEITIRRDISQVTKPVTAILDQEAEPQVNQTQSEKEGYLVDWAGQNDPMNPKNFPMPAKILIGVQV